MKKNVLIILCLLAAAGLGGLCTWQYLRQQDSLEALAQSQKQTEETAGKVTELEETLADREAYIKGQEEYVSELSSQLAALEALGEENSDEEETDDGEEEDNPYQYDYPELYAQAEYDRRHPAEDDDEEKEKKTAYLTFDDGPSSLTPKVLDILDEYNAKATFFVVYKDDAEYTSYLSEIGKRGHTLALHSYSHDYKKIYASVDNFLADFEKVYDWVYEETGLRPTLFRFPGGSTTGKRAVVDEIVEEMERRGFIYYDWNVSSGDGSNLTTTENIIDNVTSTIGYQDFPVVLMHDGPGKNATLRALPTVLEMLTEEGYEFETLNETMKPVQYVRKRRTS